MANAKEVWRTVPSLPQYQASSRGRIRRVPFTGKMPHGGLRQYGGKAWFGVWSETNRRYIFVFKGRTYKVARIVCEAFKGAAPFSMAVAMHVDENPRNNRPGNLAWGTQKQNLNAPGFLNYCCGRTGKNNPYIKGRKK